MAATFVAPHIRFLPIKLDPIHFVLNPNPQTPRKPHTSPKLDPTVGPIRQPGPTQFNSTTSSVLVPKNSCPPRPPRAASQSPSGKPGGTSLWPAPRIDAVCRDTRNRAAASAPVRGRPPLLLCSDRGLRTALISDAELDSIVVAIPLRVHHPGRPMLRLLRNSSRAQDWSRLLARTFVVEPRRLLEIDRNGPVGSCRDGKIEL